jgi:hypothetical protein
MHDFIYYNYENTGIRLCNRSAFTALRYGRKTWTMKTKNKCKIKAAEMKFIRGARKYV